MKKQMKRMFCLLLVVALVFAGTIPASAASHPYTDVSSGAWYNGAVEYVYTNNLMAGTSGTTFSPNSNLKREDAVVFLGQIYEASTKTTISSSYTTTFTDVQNKSAYYYKYIGWAKAKGFVSGLTSTSFGVGQYITRKDLAVMAYLFQMNLKSNYIWKYSVPSYSDISTLSADQKTAIEGCGIMGIMVGNADGTFKPQNYVTRAEAAAIAQNICVNQKWLS